MMNDGLFVGPVVRRLPEVYGGDRGRLQSPALGCSLLLPSDTDARQPSYPRALPHADQPVYDSQRQVSLRFF